MKRTPSKIGRDKHLSNSNQHIERATVSANLRRRFAVELSVVIGLGVLLGFATAETFISWSGVSLTPDPNPEPVPGTFRSFSLVTLGLFGPVIWPGFFALIYIFFARARKKRWEAKQWQVDDDLRAQRVAETQRRIGEAQTAGVLDRWSKN